MRESREAELERENETLRLALRMLQEMIGTALLLSGSPIGGVQNCPSVVA